MPFTKGDTVNLYICTESTYGLVPTPSTTNPVKVLGIIRTISSPDTNTVQEIPKQGDRKRGGAVLVSRAVSWNASINVPADCIADLMSLAPSTTSEPSVTMKFKTGTLVHQFVGSMVDTMTLSASEIGGFITVDLDCKAKWHSMKYTGGDLKKPDGTTMTELPTNSVAEPGLPQTYNKWWRCSYSTDAGVPVENYNYYNSWKITIKENLQGVPAISSETNGIRLDYGYKSVPQAYEVELELTSPAPVGNTNNWELARVGNTLMTSTWSIVLGNKTLTLSGCVLDPAGPTRTSDGGYDDTLKFKCTSLVVS